MSCERANEVEIHLELRNRDINFGTMRKKWLMEV